METIFKKLGLAITFSPTGKALLYEVKRLAGLFNSSLVLIHAGKKDNYTEELLFNTVTSAGIDYNNIDIIWAEGDPASAIIKSSHNAGVDLLVAGALEKEKFIKYYLGSVARRIMRESSSSVLILTTPSVTHNAFKKFYVSADYSAESEKTLKLTFSFARLEQAEQFVILKDFHLPGLASSILGSGSVEETQSVRKEWIRQEEETMRIFVKDLNLSGVPVNVKALYGKEGWEAGNYAKSKGADLFAISAPVKKLKFLDRVFTHEIEYLFENLPTNLLIIK